MAKVGGTTVASKVNNTPKTDAQQVSPAPVAKQEEVKQAPIEKNETPKNETPADQKAPEAPKKEVKMPEPKAWQRIDVSDPLKPKLVNQITFLGEKMDYEPGFRAEYDWNNLDNSDGLKRVVTAKFPKSEHADGTDAVDFMNYKITIDKYGNSAVCKVEGPWKDAEGNDIQSGLILEYVSLATVLDVLQDLLNPKEEDGTGTCTIPWGTIDQVIKKKRNLKSRIKNLGENDLPARSQRKKEEPAPELAEGEKKAEEAKA